MWLEIKQQNLWKKTKKVKEDDGRQKKGTVQ
jgi:hypothetical protein